MKLPLASLAPFAALLFLANCSDDNAPGPNPAGAGSGSGPSASGGGGSSGASTGGGGGSGAGAGGGGIAPSFATLKGVIQSSCFGAICHDLPEHPLQLKVDDQLYTTLTTHVTKHCGALLTPGSPQDSALVNLLKGPCNGTERMPYGKCSADGDEGCVSPDYIAAIEKWIAGGAPP